MGLLQKETGNTVFHAAGQCPAIRQEHIPQGWRLLCSCVNSSVPTESEYEGYDSFGRRASLGEVESPQE